MRVDTDLLKYCKMYRVNNHSSSILLSMSVMDYLDDMNLAKRLMFHVGGSIHGLVKVKVPSTRHSSLSAS